MFTVETLESKNRKFLSVISEVYVCVYGCTTSLYIYLYYIQFM